MSFTCVFKSGIDRRALFEARAGAEAEGLKKNTEAEEGAQIRIHKVTLRPKKWVHNG